MSVIEGRPVGRQELDPAPLGKGLAVLRIFFGVISFSNGLAKLLDFRTIDIGPYASTLVDRPEARAILDFEVNRRGGNGTDVPLLPTLVNDVILPSYDVLQWVLTATELGVGALLILGLATRGAALVGFALHFFLQLVYLSSGRFAFEQPHEWLPLAILAVVPAGLVWGLDGRLAARSERFRRWPF